MATSDKQDFDYSQIAKKVEKSLTKQRFLVPYNTPQILSATFVRGMVFGVGSVVGAALLILASGYVIARLGGVPVVGELLVKFGEALSQAH